MSRGEIAHDVGFVEIGDRCWVARHAHLDVNVGLVGGDRGLVVVDTHASESAARGVLEEVRRLGAGDVVAVVNTHDHFGHCLGNPVFTDAYDEVPVLAHEAAAQQIAQQVGEVARPTRTFSSARAVDLGDRVVEVVHPGRGHTAGDAVVLVPDAGVVYAGDLVEESGPPGFGPDCFPLEWTATLDLLLSLVQDSTVVVPGHGLPVDREFMMDQRGDIGMVAETLRDLAGRGVPAESALAQAEWPFPVEHLADAVARAYAHLPRGARSLPLA